jgi:polyphosphate kinase
MDQFIMQKRNSYFIHRDISWLSFNERVLQEAEDQSVPLLERIKFLGIFSNNLDEFFRVRVAYNRRMSALPKKAQTALGYNPNEVLEEIHDTVVNQQQKFETVFAQIIKELKEKNILFVNETNLDENQQLFLRRYFEEIVRPTLVPIMFDKPAGFPNLKDKAIYLAVKLSKKGSKKTSAQYAVIEVPVPIIPRFVELPARGEQKCIILVDDVVRYFLQDVFAIFDFNSITAYTVKMTRDAELDLNDDVSKSFLEKMTKSLKERKKGRPVRLVYDKEMPKDLLNTILKALKLNDQENVIPGGRYHNFKDFINFPMVGDDDLRYEDLKPQRHFKLHGVKSMFEVIKKQDILLSYPYQSFGHIIDLLREAAIDPKVTSIKINLYRVASRSKIINALINAVKNGKQVTCVVELQARFDEENNIIVANKLQDAGVKIIFGVPGLKVHSKLILIDRKENNKTVQYAHVGTGNFHEGTARVYTDYSLLTFNTKITREVNKVFEFFKNNYKPGVYKNLLVSPFNFRTKMTAHINEEIKNAKTGKEAYIILKMNSLVDDMMIKKLYEASNAGVKIKLIIRGICSLLPGLPGLSENIEAISIVDRFLEHSRVFVFCSGGKQTVYISSADWMPRNIDRRIEVGTPILDPFIKGKILKMLDIQLKDNVKSRRLDPAELNEYIHNLEPPYRSQYEQYKFLESELEEQIPEIQDSEKTEI